MMDAHSIQIAIYVLEVNAVFWVAMLLSMFIKF